MPGLPEGFVVRHAVELGMKGMCSTHIQISGWPVVLMALLLVVGDTVFWGVADSDGGQLGCLQVVLFLYEACGFWKRHLSRQASTSRCHL